MIPRSPDPPIPFTRPNALDRVAPAQGERAADSRLPVVPAHHLVERHRVATAAGDLDEHVVCEVLVVQNLAQPCCSAGVGVVEDHGVATVPISSDCGTLCHHDMRTLRY